MRRGEVSPFPPPAWGVVKALGLSRGFFQHDGVLPTQNGALRLFRFAGIRVYLHWSWFVVAAFEINNRRDHYTSVFWNAAEYLALFCIVLLHEFGHSLACRQTGGQADTIVLWPLGGVAYVAPPARPGATLWSIAAGPLVNVILLPITLGLLFLTHAVGWDQTQPNVHRFCEAVATMNAALLIFNLIPVYPLDGGQIVRSLLWFAIGQARSLIVSSYIGLAGVLALGVFALVNQSFWLGVIAAFMFFICRRSLQHARQLQLAEKAVARPGFACPVCHQPPLVGAFWICQRCRTPFDTFATGAICPTCQEEFPITTCPRCQAARPWNEWMKAVPPPLPPDH